MAINTRLQHKIGLLSELITLQCKRSPRRKMNYRLQLQVLAPPKRYEFQFKVGPVSENCPVMDCTVVKRRQVTLVTNAFFPC